MAGLRLLLLALLSAACVACGDDGESEPTQPGPPDPVVEGCAAGETDDGMDGCIPAGVPPERCAEGFVAEADGCVAVLPSEPCAPGSMALPGETSCREVAPCGTDPWGDIPVDGSTQYVDASYGGGNSNGSSAAPWTTIQAGVDAAAAGAVVAVAAGQYAEEVLLQAPVAVWGRCPSMVEIAGVSQRAAVRLTSAAASGSSLHTIAISGPQAGVYASTAVEASFDRVWVHDTGDRGFDFQESFDSPIATIEGCLVEQAQDIGVYLEGATVTISDSIVRDIQPQGGSAGRGIHVDSGMQQHGALTMSHSIVERTRELGVLVSGADATLDGVLIRDTQPVNQQDGNGIYLQASRTTSLPAVLTLTSSVIERTVEGGVALLSSVATIEASVVRDTLPDGTTQLVGRGVRARPDDVLQMPSSVTVRQSLIERNHDIGIFASGSSAVIESTVVRDTLSRLADGDFGRGIVIQYDELDQTRGSLELRGSVIRNNRDVGVFGAGADLVIDNTLVADTLPRDADGLGGRGVLAQSFVDFAAPSTLQMSASAVERSIEFGISALGADATVTSTHIVDTAAQGGTNLFGDGFVVARVDEAGTATVDQLTIERSTRAGVASFGGVLSLSNTELSCAAIDIAVETFGAFTPELRDEGGNACGCSDEVHACRAATSGLEPPPAL